MAMRFPKRMPMKQWLKEKLDSQSYPGLRWIDKKRGKFEVLWKHGSSLDWNWQEDVMVFREWAVYTGKYQPKGNCSTSEEDLELAKKWKTNFRCALNALPGVQYLERESVSRGSKAKKVFIIKKEKNSKYQRTGNNLKSEPTLTQCSIHETEPGDLKVMSPFNQDIDQVFEGIEDIEKGFAALPDSSIFGGYQAIIDNDNHSGYWQSTLCMYVQSTCASFSWQIVDVQDTL